MLCVHIYSFLILSMFRGGSSRKSLLVLAYSWSVQCYYYSKLTLLVYSSLFPCSLFLHHGAVLCCASVFQLDGMIALISQISLSTAPSPSLSHTQFCSRQGKFCSVREHRDFDRNACLASKSALPPRLSTSTCEPCHCMTVPGFFQLTIHQIRSI
jgi:hypothetical protein